MITTLKQLALFALLLVLPLFGFAAQVDAPDTFPSSVLWLRSSNTAVSVPAAGNTQLLAVNVQRISRIFVQFSVATQNLDAFIIQIQDHPSGALQTIASVAGDYTAPKGLLVGTSGDLTTVAAAGSGWFILDTTGLYAVVISASAAVDSAAVTIYAGGR